MEWDLGVALDWTWSLYTLEVDRFNSACLSKEYKWLVLTYLL